MKTPPADGQASGQTARPAVPRNLAHDVAMLTVDVLVIHGHAAHAVPELRET